MAASARLIVALDSGAVIGLARGDEHVRAHLRVWMNNDANFIIPAPVLAEVLRGTSRDAAVHRVLSASGADIVPLSPQAARKAGELLGRTQGEGGRTLDALIVAVARECLATDIVTSDPHDITVLAEKALVVVAV